MTEMSRAMRAVATDRAPAAIGPYSQAVVAGDTVYCSGQIGIDPATGDVPAGVEAQTEQVLRNLTAVLEAAGSSMDRVVKTGVYLTDMENFPAMNAIYEKFFGDPPPARATVAVRGLPKGVDVEIDAIALTSGDTGA